MKDCQDYTMDFERSLHERLTLREKLGLRFHITICPDCRKYFEDSKYIEKLLVRGFKDKRSYSFTKQEKNSIKEKILLD